MTDSVDKGASRAGQGSRGLAHRCLSRSSGESNVALGNFTELVPDRQYRAIGLDIGRDNVDKPGVEEGWAKVRAAYQRAPGSTIVVRGLESPSVRSGSPGLAERRAKAVKAALVSRGVPADAISIKAVPPNRLDPRRLSPQEKAAMRGAAIELIPPSRRSHNALEVDDDARLLKRSAGPSWPRLLRRFPDPVEQLLVDDPQQVDVIAGHRLLHQDLVTVGQMLEEERDTDTLRAALLFAGAIPVGKISWGHGEGGGNALLPLRDGSVVDIDWLNVMVGVGISDPQTAFLGYGIGKPLWAFFHGLAKGVSAKNYETGRAIAVGHMRAFGNPSEANAAVLAAMRAVWEWTYPDILHPELVRQAKVALEAERRHHAAKRRPGYGR